MWSDSSKKFYRFGSSWVHVGSIIAVLPGSTNESAIICLDGGSTVVVEMSPDKVIKTMTSNMSNHQKTTDSMKSKENLSNDF